MKNASAASRRILPILALVSAFSALTGICVAQPVLEAGAGRALIRVAPGASVAVDLAASHLPRTALAAEGGWVVAGEDLATGDLFFVLREGGAEIDLPVPDRVGPGTRARPVLLGSLARLDGAVWLEDSGAGAAIHAAAWNGTSWEATETVAPATGRPQLAPAAAVLDDGRWLVVWAGFDGEDDEIFWSLRSSLDGAWSPPRRIHRGNRVPDILPALTAEGRGALAAWSSFDGNDYRVVTARWEDGRWTSHGPLAGLGADDANWQKAGEGVVVTYRSVEPEGWTAAEIGPAGGVLRQVVVPNLSLDRPLVVAGDGGGLGLHWPRREGRVER